MTIKEIRKTEQYKAAKVIIKRHGGFNLVGKYYMTEADKERYLMDAIRTTEIQLQAMKDMLKEKDFH